jgi:hypothetical protein
VSIEERYELVEGIEVRLTVNPKNGGKTYSIKCPKCGICITDPTWYADETDLRKRVRNDIQDHEPHCMLNELYKQLNEANCVTRMTRSALSQLHNAVTTMNLERNKRF